MNWIIKRWNDFLCWLDGHRWNSKPFGNLRKCKHCHKWQSFTNEGWKDINP